MKAFITICRTRQARVVHSGNNCPLTADEKGAFDSKRFIEVDVSSLRVFKRCRYCFS
jgi:hypothetical protein